MKTYEDLKDRVEKFQAGTLPGQPIGVHMGTFYLVNDLWQEIESLRMQLEAALHKDAAL